MVMLILKRMQTPLDRDVIFLAEASEEGGGSVGIDLMVSKYWPEIEAEYCFAEGGGGVRTNGKMQYVGVATTEKIPKGARLVARGISGHGSVPLRSNAIVHLSQAVAKVAEWRTPMRLNETTRAYFERLATISPAAEAERFRKLVANGDEASQEYLAINSPRLYSTLRTSISPNIITALVSGSASNAARQSMCVVPMTGSPPMPIAVEKPRSRTGSATRRGENTLSNVPTKCDALIASFAERDGIQAAG